jgi:very-short-patch-repair endonuclease
MTAERAKHRQNVPAARELRGRQTPAESVLWDALRGRRLVGFKFRRQHPIGPLVVDFCCPDCRLAIEVDREVHTTQRAHDDEREALLVKAGYRMVRFSNQAVQSDLSSVLDQIRMVAHSEPPRSAQPIPRTGGWG